MSCRVWRTVQGLGIAGGLALGGAVVAEPDPYIRGSLSLSGVQDDNLFSTPGDSAQSDSISRLSPGFEAGLVSDRLSITGRYTVDAERYSEHPELDNNRARQLASFDFHGRAARTLTMALQGEYLSTLTPGDLNLTTGLQAGRARATRLTVTPTLDWRIGPKANATAAFTEARDDVETGLSTEVRTAALGLRRRLSRRSTGSLGYTVGRYDFGTEIVSTAHTLSLGWERTLGSLGELELRGGPRYSNGDVDPEVSIALRHDAKSLHLSLIAARSLATVVGRAGTVVSDSVLPAVSWQARHFLRLSAAPGMFWTRDSRGGPEVRVRVVELGAVLDMTDWLSLAGTYRRSLQRGALESTGGGGEIEAIARDTFLLVLVARQGKPRALAAAGPSSEVTP